MNLYLAMGSFSPLNSELTSPISPSLEKRNEGKVVPILFWFTESFLGKNKIKNVV